MKEDNTVLDSATMPVRILWFTGNMQEHWQTNWQNVMRRIRMSPAGM